MSPSSREADSDVGAEVMTLDQLHHMDGLLRAVRQVAQEAIDHVRRDLAQGYAYLTRVVPVNAIAYTGLEETLKLILEGKERSRKDVQSHRHDLHALVTEVRGAEPAFGSIVEEAYRWHSEMVDDYHPEATPLHRGRTLDEFLAEVKKRRLHEGFRYWIREEEFRERVQDEPVDPRLLIELWEALIAGVDYANKGESVARGWRSCKVVLVDQSLGALHHPASLPSELEARIRSAQEKYLGARSAYLRTGEVERFREMERRGDSFREAVEAAREQPAAATAQDTQSFR